MVVTGRVQDLILNPEETGKISDVIAEGLLRDADVRPGTARLRHGRAVTEEVALELASSPHDFKMMLGARGERASGIEQVMGNGDGASAAGRQLLATQ